MGILATTVFPSLSRIGIPNPGRSPKLWILAALAIAIPTTALGDEIHMAWNACELEGGTSVENFACDTDAGEHVAVASFALDAGLIGFQGMEGEIHLGWPLGTNSILPDWWSTGPGTCREGAITLSFDFLDSPQTSCLDLWSGQALSGLLVDVVTTPNLPPHGSSTYGRIRFQAGLSSGPVDLNAGQEYLAFKIRIRNTGTTGPGGCDGCCENAALVTPMLRLFGTEERSMYPPNDRIQWQSPTGCRPVPSLARSWGQVRGMYR